MKPLIQKALQLLATAIMSEKAYAEFVVDRFEVASKADAPIIFTNRGTPHAKTVLEQIITRATTSLSIFSGSVSSDVYDALQLADAVDRLGNVRIIVSDRVSAGRSALMELGSEIHSGKLRVRHFDTKIMAGAKRKAIQHFALWDGRHIRAEENAIDRSATVILNADRDTSKSLAKSYMVLFDAMWKQSVEWIMPLV